MQAASLHLLAIHFPFEARQRFEGRRSPNSAPFRANLSLPATGTRFGFVADGSRSPSAAPSPNLPLLRQPCSAQAAQALAA